MAGRALPADAQVFLGRLTHLDPGALVRLRPAAPGPTAPGPTAPGPTAPGRTALWARLPWGVLVTREVELDPTADRTVAAAALLAGDTSPPRRDPEWRWPLPPHAGTVIEEIPAHRLREVAAAAAGTLREVTAAGLAGRPVGARVLREALLDHVPIIVETTAGRIDVPQRLVQAAVRMGFLGEHPDAPVRVRQARRWLGLAARYGTAWLPPAPLPVRPLTR